jgi:hypothetical protein
MTDVRKLILLAETHPAPPGAPIESATLPAIPSEEFRIDSLAKADWALEVLAASDARKAENGAIADEARRRVDEWLARVNGQEDKDTAYLRAVLEEFMSAQRPLILGAKSKKKSRELPHGVLGWKATPRKLVYDDEAAALAWAKARPVEEGLYRVDYKLEKDAVKRLADSEQVIPPGARWEGGEDVPFVKPTIPALPERSASPELVKETP